jgi:hypothetical protein
MTNDVAATLSAPVMPPGATCARRRPTGRHASAEPEKHDAQVTDAPEPGAAIVTIWN